MKEESTGIRNKAEAPVEMAAEIMSMEELAQIAGGAQGSLGIQWDDPRCAQAAAMARNFASLFQEGNFDPVDKSLISWLCNEFCSFVNSKQRFNINRAKNVHSDIASEISGLKLEPVLSNAWSAFTNTINSIPS